MGVCYSFHHAGRWHPDAVETRGRFRHDPAMFKVQVQRALAPGESPGDDDPMLDFLEELIPEIERRLGTDPAAA